MKRSPSRYVLILVALCAALSLPAKADDWDQVDPDYKHAPVKALEAWRDLKFGLRIHWGVYSIWAAGPESWPLTNHPLDWQGRYAQLYQTWNPTGFDPDAWADMMARDGLKFFVFTAKHHDGFSMYDTRTLDYTGDWLRVNGQAIYATRPWTYWKEGDSIRFTRSKDRRTVYAISLKWPGASLRLKSIQPKRGSRITMLGVSKPLPWRLDPQGGVVIDIPANLQPESARPCKQAWTFRIEGIPVESGTKTAALVGHSRVK